MKKSPRAGPIGQLELTSPLLEFVAVAARFFASRYRNAESKTKLDAFGVAERGAVSAFAVTFAITFRIGFIVVETVMNATDFLVPVIAPTARFGE